MIIANYSEKSSLSSREDGHSVLCPYATGETCSFQAGEVARENAEFCGDVKTVSSRFRRASRGSQVASRVPWK